MCGFFFMINFLIIYIFKVLSFYLDVVWIKIFNMNIVFSLNKKDIICLRRMMKIVF